MICRKLGQIFETAKYGLDYSKSPQAIVLEDRVRIYFTACEKDGEKLKSIPSYVDFDLDLKEILGINKSIIPNGGLGCFDEHGIFPFSPLVDDDKIYAYTSGINRRVSVSVDSGIGLAISTDGGVNFNRYGEGPILTSSLYEPFLVIDGFVKKYEGKYHMWYIAGTEWNVFVEGCEPDRTYLIKHATSDDGINWKKENRNIITQKKLYESQALPTIFSFNNVYYMIFCYRDSYDFRTNNKNSYKLGFAESTDLINWERNDNKLEITFGNDQEWDCNMMCYPNVFQLKGKYYLLYNGNEFGKHGFGIAEILINAEEGD